LGTHPENSEEKVKPFKLVKYFTSISLILIFTVTIILILFNTRWARTMQQKKSEDYALLQIDNLNHQLFLQFVIPVAVKGGGIHLREKEQFKLMDNVVRRSLHSFKVEIVNIYSTDNIISYSYDPKFLGKKNIGGKAYYAALSGKAISHLEEKGNWLSKFFGFPRDSKIITFAPLVATYDVKIRDRLIVKAGSILGIIEIVQNLSEDYKAISRFQVLIMITSALVMGTLFIILFFVVKRGEEIIEKRALEKLELKERLSRAERLSSMGEMTASISHEIRNPLGIIRSSAELLKKKLAEFDPENKIPEIIVEESNRLNAIITDFINYAKPRNPNLIPCRVEEIIEKNISFLVPQLAEQKYKIRKDYTGKPLEIMADSDMLYQAFLNLLINAMHAMPGGGEINIEIGCHDEKVEITFVDDGDGIPVELIDKIWDPFFTTKDTGTGLGLGIVKNMIKSLGGSIKAGNRPGHGAEFVVTLPVKPEV